MNKLTVNTATHHPLEQIDRCLETTGDSFSDRLLKLSAIAASLASSNLELTRELIAQFRENFDLSMALLALTRMGTDQSVNLSNSTLDDIGLSPLTNFQVDDIGIYHMLCAVISHINGDYSCMEYHLSQAKIDDEIKIRSLVLATNIFSLTEDTATNSRKRND
ncbi:hypothetical protein [Vibrio comitans]|nr:hypothetical protein [Vibrio comitans]